MRAPLPQPEPGPLAIGAKLRETRLAQQLTLAEVSAATGLTVGALSRIERDQLSPSVSTLVSICQVLSLSVGALFEVASTGHIALEDAPQINMGGHLVDDRLVTPREEARVQMLRSSMEVGAHGGTELYAVNCEVETFHLLSGTVEIVFSNKTVTLQAGETLTFPGRAPHTWRNAGTTTAHAVWIMVPAAWSGSA